MKLFSKLKKIDIFGRSVELRLDKKKVHKTYCGACMTLLIFLITILIVFIYVNQYTQYDNPFLRVYEMETLNEQHLLNSKIDAFSTNFRLKLQNSFTKLPLNTSQLVYVAKIVSVDNSSGSVTYEQFSLEQCIEDKSTFCLDNSKSMYLKPYSSFINSSAQYLEVSIFDCSSYNTLTSSNIACDTSFSSSSAELLLSFNEQLVSPRSYNYPISSKQHQLSVDLGQPSQIIDIYFQEIIVQTDRGIVWEENHTQQILSFHKTASQKQQSSSVIKPLSVINVLLDSKSTYYERSYSKIQVYMAYIGGILKMLTVLGEFFTRPFVRLSLNTKIVNEVFDFEGGELEEMSGDLDSDIDSNENSSPIPKWERERSFASIRHRFLSQSIADPGFEQPSKDQLHSITVLAGEQINPEPMIKIELINTQNDHESKFKHNQASVTQQFSTETQGNVGYRQKISETTTKTGMKNSSSPVLTSLPFVRRQSSCLSNCGQKKKSSLEIPNTHSQEIHHQSSLERISEKTIGVSQVQQISPCVPPFQQFSKEEQETSIQEYQYTEQKQKQQQSDGNEVEKEESFSELSSDQEEQPFPSLPSNHVTPRRSEILQRPFQTHQLVQTHRVEKVQPSPKFAAQLSLRVAHTSSVNHTSSFSPENVQKVKNRDLPSHLKGNNINKSITSSHPILSRHNSSPESQLNFIKNNKSILRNYDNNSNSTPQNKKNSSLQSKHPSSFFQDDIEKTDRIQHSHQNSENEYQKHIEHQTIAKEELISHLNKIRPSFHSEKGLSDGTKGIHNQTENEQERNSSPNKMRLSLQPPLLNHHFSANENKGFNSPAPLNRSYSKSYSVLEKKKIVAMRKLIDNYQNKLETPADTLKNYEKLIDGKKKSNDANNIFKRLFTQGKVLKLRFYDYILYYLQCFNRIYSEKKKQIRFSKEKVKERLDVVYIIQKLVEIDKLKILLLNEDQQKLFEYLPKPIVHINPKEQLDSPGLKMVQGPQNMLEAWSMLHQQKKSIVKATEASIVYKDMMSKDLNELSQIDKKLIDMLDFRIKDIFNKNNRSSSKSFNNHKGISPFNQHGIIPDANESQAVFLENTNCDNPTNNNSRIIRQKPQINGMHIKELNKLLKYSDDVEQGHLNAEPNQQKKTSFGSPEGISTHEAQMAVLNNQRNNHFERIHQPRLSCLKLHPSSQNITEKAQTAGKFS